jgi:hypothetical protein
MSDSMMPTWAKAVLDPFASTAYLSGLTFFYISSPPRGTISFVHI